jgi:hypothetical protein
MEVATAVGDRGWRRLARLAVALLVGACSGAAPVAPANPSSITSNRPQQAPDPGAAASSMPVGASVPTSPNSSPTNQPPTVVPSNENRKPTLLGYELLATTVTQARSDRSLDCVHVNRPYAEDSCRLLTTKVETFPSARASSVSLNFFGGRLHHIYAHFPSAEYPAIARRLEEQWGTPTSRRGTPQSEEIRWNVGNAELSVSRRAGASEGIVQLESSEYRSEQARRFEAEEAAFAGPTNDPPARDLQRVCESATKDDGVRCAQWFSAAVEKARQLVRLDDAKRDRQAAACEPLLFDNMDRPRLLNTARAVFLELAHEERLEKQMELPVRTIIHLTLRVVCGKAQ